MSDHHLYAALTFSLLAAGTAAIGSEMFTPRHADVARSPVVTLPQVTVTAHRVAALDVVTLPAVTITKHCDPATRLAVETQANEPRRMQ
jgi:hypothetical protein